MKLILKKYQSLHFTDHKRLKCNPRSECPSTAIRTVFPYTCSESSRNCPNDVCTIATESLEEGSFYALSGSSSRVQADQVAGLGEKSVSHRTGCRVIST